MNNASNNGTNSFSNTTITMGNKELSMECLQVNNAITWMADKFAKTYYWEDFQIQWIDWEDDCLHYNLQINDEYRNIDEIYTALWYDIPKKILFKYYDERFEKSLKHETMPNLKNYFNLFKNVPNDNS